MIREAPFEARFSQVAAPMPREAPVTRAILPSRTREPLPPTRLVEAILEDVGRDMLMVESNG